MTLRDARMNRHALEITDLDDQGNELAYWLTRTPAERLKALEFLRQIHYGYDPLTARLTRVLVVESGSGRPKELGDLSELHAEP